MRNAVYFRLCIDLMHQLHPRDLRAPITRGMPNGSITLQMVTSLTCISQVSTGNTCRASLLISEGASAAIQLRSISFSQISSNFSAVYDPLLQNVDIINHHSSIISASKGTSVNSIPKDQASMIYKVPPELELIPFPF